MIVQVYSWVITQIQNLKGRTQFRESIEGGYGILAQVEQGQVFEGAQGLDESCGDSGQARLRSVV